MKAGIARVVGASALLVALAVAPHVAWARASQQALDTIAVTALSTEARAVLMRIHDGGPFRYSRDGVVFGNRERILPQQSRGYYHEYTVHTPGDSTRGARRIVCGGAKTRPDGCFYSDDHYASFRRIVE